MILKLVKGPIR